MARFLIDTNHITHYEHRHPRVWSRFQAEPPGQIVVSIIAVEELLRGRLATVAQRSAAGGARLVTAYQYLEEGCNLIREFAIIGFDAMAEATFRGLKSSVPQAGTRDLRIASTALAHNLIVVTANKNDFTGISGLTFEDWTA